jgi:hypothetical protein
VSIVTNAWQSYKYKIKTIGRLRCTIWLLQHFLSFIVTMVTVCLVLLVNETKVTTESRRPTASHCQTLAHKMLLSISRKDPESS